jgi:hypothetical protein
MLSPSSKELAMKKTIVASTLALTLALAGSAFADAPGYNKQRKPAPYGQTKKAPAKRAPVVMAPVVTAAPSHAVAGQVIVLRGQRLAQTVGLRLGPMTLAPTFRSPTQLRFAVPKNMVARSYPMVLVTRHRSQRIGTLALRRPAPAFTFMVSSAPRSAVLGQVITIRGQRLHKGLTLRIGNKTIAPRWVSATSIQFVIPRTLLARSYQMTLAGPRVAKNLGTIALRRPAPKPRWSYNVGWFFNLAS